MIGGMRDRVAIKQPNGSYDSMGGVPATYSTVATVWGKCEPLSAQAQVLAGADYNGVNYQITIRNLSGIKSGWRADWGSVGGMIVSINPADDRKQFMRLDVRVTEGA